MGGSATTKGSPEPADPIKAAKGAQGASQGAGLALEPKGTTCNVKVSDVDGKVSNLAAGEAKCYVKQIKLDGTAAYEDYGLAAATVSWTSLMPTALTLRAYLRSTACSGSNPQHCSLAMAEGSTSPLKLDLDGDLYKEHAADLLLILFSDGPTYEQPVKIELSVLP